MPKICDVMSRPALLRGAVSRLAVGGGSIGRLLD
jgi:hypothetical protein